MALLLLASRVHAALTAQGVIVESVSIGDDQDRTTWRVSPASKQAQAQPILDAFVPPTAQELADEDAQREADLRILKAITIELHAAIPAWAGKPTLVQLRANIIARYKALA